MINQEIFDSFFENVARRLKRYNSSPKNLITEDCIRYDFYATLFRDFKSDDLITEYPHDHELLKGKEIDLVVNNNLYTAIFEFKYYRKIPSRREDKTGRIASIYIDIAKLKLSSISPNKFFILLTDQVMHNYIKNNDYEYMLFNQKVEPFDFRFSDKHLLGKHVSNQVQKKLGKDHDFKVLTSISKIYENSVCVDLENSTDQIYLYIYKIH